MNDTLLIVKDLSIKLQGVAVLDNVSFELKPHQHLLIKGESGTGKTMLAKALGGQIFHHGNIDIQFDEESILKPRVSLVEQHYHFKNLSNVAEFYYQQRYNSFDAEDSPTVWQELMRIEKDYDAIDIWLTRLNMQHHKYSPLIQLSSGEHKRFQLIRTFLLQPQFIILDSPFCGLDVNTRNHLHHIIDNAAAMGATIIIIANENDIPSCITHELTLQKGKVANFDAREISEAKQKYPYPAFTSLNSCQLPAVEMNLNFTDAVRMKNVSVQYGNKKILQNINWQVKQDDRWLVKGPNGVGKSTLLSLITGDNPKAYANEIYLFDKRRGSGESIWDIKQKIGYISPELHWYFDTNTSCFEVVGSGFFDTIGLFRNLTAQQQKLVQQWLDFLRLSDVTKKQLATISAGQQRLVLLARALVKNPPLFILDEPCQGLDDTQTQNFVDIIDAICMQHSKTLIYVSHYEHEIPKCITNIFTLQQNKYTISAVNKEEIIAA